MGKKLFLFAAAAVALASCTETDLSGDTSFAKESTSDAIQFSAKTGNAGTTRAGYAGDLTNETIKNSAAGFGVFAYYSGNKTITAWGNWENTTPTAINQAPNFMYNQKVTWSQTSPTDQWNYEPVKYWPNGIDAANAENSPSNSATEANPQYLSFFAYAPYVYQNTSTTYEVSNSHVGGEAAVPSAVGTAVYTGDAANPSAPTATQNGIVAMSKNDQAKDMYVKYILNPAKDANKKFVDLLWGLRGQVIYNETDGSNNDLGAVLGSAYNTDLTKQTTGEKVKFLFKHALSRVGGNTSTSSSASGSQVCGLWAVVDIDKNSTVAGEGQSDQTTYFSNDFNKAKTLVTIEEVKIRDQYTYGQEQVPPTSLKSDFLTDGWFDIMSGKWIETATRLDHTEDGNGVIYNVTAKSTPGTGEYKLNPAIKENGVTNSNGEDWNGTNSGGSTGVNLTKEKVYAADEDVPGLLLIPGVNGNTLYITVKYRVRTADPNLSTGFSEVTQTITNKVTIGGAAPNNLEPNKYYNLVMHLGLTSVKFEAVVADWSGDSDTYEDDGEEITPGTGHDKSVWLPSNVVQVVSNETIAYNGGNKEITLSDVVGTLKVVSVAGNIVVDVSNVAIDGSKVTLTCANNDGAQRTGVVKVADDVKTYIINLTQEAQP